MINYEQDKVRFKNDTGHLKLFNFIKTGLFWVLCFIISLIAVDLYAFLGRTIILFAIIGGLLSSMISHYLVPTERPNQMITAKKNLFMYSSALVVAYFVITALNSIDPNMAGVSLGLSTGQVTNNATLGWLQLMIQFIIVGAPISHIGYEAKRIMTYYGFGYGHVTKRTRAEQLQKTIVPRKR